MDYLPKIFALDVDGVLTDGKFLWDAEGRKVYKQFGPDDSDALKLLRKTIPDLKVCFFTQDKMGAPISISRLEHMGFKKDEDIFCISSKDRYGFIKERWGLGNSIYMGDSFLDVPLLRDCRWSCAPSDSSIYARYAALKVLECPGGGRAVSEAVMWIMKDIFGLRGVRLYGDMRLPMNPEEIVRRY